MRRELTIARLGNHADGIAETDSGPVYVPFALPGERLVAEVDGNRGQIAEILQTAPERIDPICGHFGVCGGCAVQHLDWSRYLDWKKQRVIDALSMEGIDAPIEPVRAFGPHSRRRATFAAEKTGKALTFGLRRAHSHEIVALQECPVLLPRLEASIPLLRELLSELLAQGEARVLVTACDNGLDINIDSAKLTLRRMTPAIGLAAEASGIIRITIEDDPIFSLTAPKVTISGAVVDLPPRAFLQASGEAETAMAAIAVEAVGKARKIADLYSGLGGFSFALARKAAVTAVDTDRKLLDALEGATRRAPGFKPIRTLARNLAREPLSPMELNAFDAVLFDPPRVGAAAQATALAKSRVKKIVAVSCNPVSFAKDARALIDGGYTLERVVPIDQFVYSAHIELVAGFSRV
jgi:23S rRNA (uracil1939-C5)-methyltransferase